ncbi:hypothetical protein ACM66B_004543 [Microbotryomycetes sp. NB124-2]
MSSGSEQQTRESVFERVQAHSNRSHYLVFMASHERGRPWCRSVTLFNKLAGRRKLLQLPVLAVYTASARWSAPAQARLIVDMPGHRDCENAQPYISNYIKPLESTTIYVGSRDEWNKPDNTWRQAPFNVERVPTVLKVEPVEHVEASTKIQHASRIVEGDILDDHKMRMFAA